jgi:hypothetical protein
MRIHRSILVLGVFALQCGLTCLTIMWQNTPLGTLAGIASAGSWILPFIGYIAALYGASFFARRSPALRAALLTFISLIATFVGSLAFLAAMMLFGIPLRT